jgi:protein TonB
MTPKDYPQLPRSLLLSATAHALLLGAGVLWGVIAAGGEPGRSRAYSATFEPPRAVDVAAAEPERPEPVPVEPAEPGEPELRESEVWSEPDASAAVDEPLPERLVAADWQVERPFEAGAIGDVAAPAAEPAPEPPPPARVEPPVYVLRIDEPVALETPAPAYPRLARRLGEEGSVLCRLQLSAQGLVTAVEIVESSGSERLDEAAREALLRWRYEPRREGGRAVATSLLHRVTFRLSEI